jgi:two-component system CheB/CheR fusion protein
MSRHDELIRVVQRLAACRDTEALLTLLRESARSLTVDELALLQALADSTTAASANVQLIDSLREAGRRKDEFLALLAHELRSPLVPLRNALHVQRLQPDDAASTARAREIMERQLQHLSGMVDDLLDVSRLTCGKVELHRERLDLGRVVREVLDERRGELSAADVTLHAEAPRTPLWVNGDAARLAQALGNLLDNAARFTPGGGFVTVRLAADAARDQAVLTVRDSGIGIDGAMLPRVFEAFAQADRSLDRSGGGLGLGLSVVRGLIELHGGTVEASSDGTGRGALFTLRLPRMAEPAALKAWSTVSAPAAASRGRILVVEDNRDAAESLRMLLEISGYEVSLAANGREGVQAAQALRPAIVLCDIGLPEMDGLEVARALRANPITALAHLIAVTGYGSDADRQRTTEAGFDAHLVKPVDPERLIGELAMVGASSRPR